MRLLLGSKVWPIGLILLVGIHSGVAATLLCDADLKKLDEPKMKELVIALAPFKLEGQKSYEQFRTKVENIVKQAKLKGANLVVLPELIASDLVEPSEKEKSLKVQFEEVAQKVTPRYISDLVQMAQGSGISILGGTFPRRAGKEIRNAAILALPTRKAVIQDKLKLTPEERDWGWKTGEILSLIEAPWGRTAILTCYDAEFAQHSAELSKLYPDLILVPSMTDSEFGFKRVRWTSQARAIEHRAYVAHVGTVGRLDKSWDNYGQASVMTPSEKGFPGILAEGKLNSDELLIVKLDMRKLRETKRKVGIYPACDEKDAKVVGKMAK